MHVLKPSKWETFTKYFWVYKSWVKFSKKWKLVELLLTKARDFALSLLSPGVHRQHTVVPMGNWARCCKSHVCNQLWNYRSLVSGTSSLYPVIRPDISFSSRAELTLFLDWQLFKNFSNTFLQSKHTVVRNMVRNLSWKTY